MTKKHTKVILFIYITFVTYALIHTFKYEVDFQGFPNRFVAFIYMYINGYVDFDYMNLIPLFQHYTSMDSSLSPMAKGVAETNSYFPNHVCLFLIINCVTLLVPNTLMVLSIGAIMIPLIYISMVRTYIDIHSYYLLYFLMAFYGISSLIMTKSCKSFYTSTSGFILMFGIFICLKKYYSEKRNMGIFSLISLVYIYSLSQYWHTVLIVSLLVILSIWVLISIAYILHFRYTWVILEEPHKKLFGRYTFFSLTSIIITLTFIHLWQSSYVGYFVQQTNLFDLISDALIKLMGGNPFSFPYVYDYKESLWGKVYFASMLSIYIISTFLLFFPIIFNIIEWRNLGKIYINTPMIFSLAIIVAQIIHVILYYTTMSLSFFYIPIFFPLFGIFLCSNTPRLMKINLVKVLIYLCLLVLILCSLSCNISLYLTREAGETAVTKYEDVKSSFDWIYNNIDKQEQFIADYNILHKYLQQEAQKSKPIISYDYLYPETYAMIVGEIKIIPSNIKGSYVAVDRATMLEGYPIYSGGSRSKLLVPFFGSINNCTSMNKLYEDSHIAIYRFL